VYFEGERVAAATLSVRNRVEEENLERNSEGDSDEEGFRVQI
jgi:hypothetical protein